jgi:hypothetical protein
MGQSRMSEFIDVSKIIDDSIAAIGSEKPQDWHLHPEQHAAQLGPGADPLKQILTAPAIAAIVEQYTTANAAAIGAQAAYKTPAKLAAITSFLAIVIGSTAVLPSSGVLPPLVISAAGVLQFLFIAISLAASIIVGRRKSFQAWMELRAEAENARRELFNQVMDEKSPAGTPSRLPLLSLQLEYFRRYQLDVQRLYYARRGAQHAGAANRAWLWRVAALAIVIIASFPLLWSLQGNAWLPDWLGRLINGLPRATENGQRLFLGIGLIASALQGLLAANAVISLDERNAARYLATSANLETLAGEPLAEARRRAARSDREGVLAFVALVQQEISSEHHEWVSLRKVAPELSLDRLASLRLPRRT